ncbi:MAG: hypothetical protein RIM99_13290 [Cyclobacteriaceae bacterium]
MKYVLIIILAMITNDPREIAKINALKKEAEKAFLAGDYEMALSKYTTLYDSMGVQEDEIKLNLAHSYYNLDDTANAKSNYAGLSTSENKKLKSIAYQQMGVISKDAGKLEESLHQLKSAIKSDPANQSARYDYEVVKKLLEEQQKQEEQQQDQEKQDQEGEDEKKEDQDQESQDQENQDEKGEQKESEEEKDGEKKENEEQKEGEEKEQEEEKSKEEMTKEKLEQMNISEEKAKMILEAMKNNEIQYLQQQKRKATERPPSNKPDW